MADPLEDLLAKCPDFDYELTELNSVLPAMTEREAPVVQTVANAFQDVMDQTCWSFYLSPTNGLASMIWSTAPAVWVQHWKHFC
jgi:hypothetical protein